MLGISTCWWHDRVDRGAEIIKGVLELGLGGIELEYRITEAMYRQMKPELNKALKVYSIHNYFPKPDTLKDAKGSGDLFLLSSTAPEERSRAVKYSIRTIEHAHELMAEVVILHLGRVEMPNFATKIKEVYGKTELSQRKALIDEKRRGRAARHQKHLDAVLSSLDELNREAEKRKLFLAIENRYHFHEIPDFDELGIILKEFEGGRIRYWHDVGHAQAQENMGILQQRELLEAYSGDMVGIHLHDAKGINDHWAPGQGEVNFEEIKTFLKPSHMKILEVHPKVDREDLLNGIQYLKNLGIE